MAPDSTRRRPTRSNHHSAGPAPVKASFPGVVDDAAAVGPADGAMAAAVGGGAVDQAPDGAAPLGVALLGAVAGAVVVVVLDTMLTTTTENPATPLPVTCPGLVSLTNVYSGAPL